MIENLKGVFETVNFKEDSGIKFYLNDRMEDYPPHWHTPLEIVMPLEREYYVQFPGESVVINEGDIAFIAPGTLHSLVSPKEKGLRIIFQVDPQILRGIKEVDSIVSQMIPYLIVYKEKDPEVASKLRECLLSIKDEYKSGSSFSETAVYSEVLTIISTMGKYLSKEEPRLSNSCNKNREYAEKFVTICDYITAHCGEDLSLEEVASIAGFSKYHFSRLFKQFTNVSFYQYLSQNRIYTAEKLLAVPEMSVTTVAYKSGFTSLSSFIRMFKLIKGVTPSEYRSMYTS